MAFNAAAAHRAIELTRYTTAQLVGFLRTAESMEDYAMVAGLIGAREDQLKANLADALGKVQAHEDLRRASLGEAECSAGLSRSAEEESRAILLAAVAEMHEAGKKKQDQVSAQVDAALAGIQALLYRQREELSASMAKIMEETEAKLKASFSKIQAPLKKPDHGAGTSQVRLHVPALTLANPSIPVARPSKQPVVEVVSEAVGAATDGSVGASLKRKADAVENRDVAPLQISGALQERVVAARISPPPGFSLFPRSSGSSSCSSSWVYMKPGPCWYTSLTQAMKANAMMSNGVEETGEGSQGNAPISDATQQDEATEAEHPARLGGGRMSLITVPLQQVERLDTETVRERARGRGSGSTVPNEKGKSLELSGGSPSLGITSSNRVVGARPELSRGQWQSHSLKLPSPVLPARPEQTCPANGSQSRNGDLFVPSNAPAAGQATTNLVSGQAAAGTRGRVHEDIIRPRPSPLRFNKAASVAQILSSSSMRSKVTENMGECVENRADSVPVINNAAEGTPHEESDVGSGANSTHEELPLGRDKP